MEKKNPRTVKPIPGLAKASPIDTLPEPISGPESGSKSRVVGEWPERYADLVALYAAVTRIGTTLEWDPFLKETLDAAIGLANADSGALMLIDEATGDLYVASARNLPDAALTQARVKTGEGVLGRIARQLQPSLLLERAQIDEYPEFFPKDRIASSVCAPLDQPGMHGLRELLGVFVLNRHMGAPAFTQDDARLVSAYCTQASKSFQILNSYRRMQRRAVQLENLIEISQNLIASLQVDVVLRSIIDRAVELLGCESGSLLLVDAETQELVFKVAVGPAGAKLVNTRLPPGAGIAGAVVRDGVSLIVHDAKADPRHYHEVDASTALETRAILCVPLINKGRVLGVIELINKANGMPFENEDRDLLAAFAAQGAIALENARLYSDLRSAFADTVRIIVNALDARDTYTAGHTGRVTEMALATAREMNWTLEQLDNLQIGAVLHDIGKIGISDSVLHKPTALTPDEYREMMRHPILGAKMLEGVAALRPMLPYILYHQERYDGLGYPFGLRGKEIPLEGRILAVADAFDAITSNRPYRQSLSEADALLEIQRNRGTQFDPDVVDAFQRALQKKPAPAAHGD
jgi:HD-GYP domain-containing protein (c-di-GMP phosphodiesterase class II)